MCGTFLGHMTHIGLRSMAQLVLQEHGVGCVPLPYGYEDIFKHIFTTLIMRKYSTFKKKRNVLGSHDSHLPEICVPGVVCP